LLQYGLAVTMKVFTGRREHLRVATGTWTTQWWTTPANVAQAIQFDRFGQVAAVYGNPALVEPGAILAPIPAHTFGYAFDNIGNRDSIS
jgi:hypothetical protein